MEKITAWAENNGIVCYRIFDVANVKRSERDCTTVNDAVNELTKDYGFLSDGKYYVKGMKNPKDDRGAVRIDFQIGVTGSNQSNNMGFDINTVRAEAYAQARKDLEYELLDRRLSEVESKQKNIIEFLREKFDDNEDNDMNADKILETLTSMKDKYEGAKDILGDLKL